MAGGVFSEANLFGMTIRESANDGSDFTNPDADYRRLFLGEDGLLHVKDSTGTVTDPFTSGSGPLSNYAATASPAVTDDDGDGYEVGSLWFDTTNDRIFACVDASTGAAIWRIVSGREQLVATWTQSQTKTDIGTSYVDIYTQSNSQDKWFSVDFVGMQQFRIDLLWNKVGAGTQMVRVIDTSGANVLYEFTNAISGNNTSGLAAVPAAFVNTRTSIKVQAKSSTAGDDPVFEALHIFLK